MEKHIYQTDWGNITLLLIGNGQYQVHDAVDDVYRGTIHFEPNEEITDTAINEKLKVEYSYAME